MNHPIQWHESSIPMEGRQLRVRTRHLPDGWDWEVLIDDHAVPNPAELADTQEHAISAALHEAAARSV